MSCENWLATIDQYVDAELPSKERAALDEHVKECARCSLEVLNRFRVKQATQIAGNRYTPSSDFRERVRRQIAGKKESPRSWWWAPALAAVVTMIVLVAITTILITRRTQREQMLTEIADIHVANLASPSPVDVVSTDRHTVKPWFQGKIPFTFNLPDLTGSEFTLVGGKVVYLEHEPAALLIFKYRNHYLSTFVLRDKPPVSSIGSTRATQDAFTTESWSSGGLRYIVITDAGREQVDALVQLLKSAARI